MREVFPIVPAGGAAYLLLVPIALLLLVGVVFVALTATSMGRGAVEVGQGELRLRAPFYGRTLPLTALDPGAAKVVDLTASGELRPSVRTNGIGLPGYASGWFRLKDGERALLLVTDRHRVLYLPTREGYALLLSVADPERLLRAIGGGGQVR